MANDQLGLIGSRSGGPPIHSLVPPHDSSVYLVAASRRPRELSGSQSCPLNWQLKHSADLYSTNSYRRLYPSPCLKVASTMSSPTCYFPDGVVDVESIACDPSAPVSSCCLPGDNCMSNGLCNNGGTDLTSIVRNSCTDSSWASLSCPQYCVGGAISGGYGDNSLGSSNVLFECSNEPSHYYCDGVNADTDCSGGGIYDFSKIRLEPLNTTFP